MLSQAPKPVTERRYFTDRPTPDELKALGRLLPGGVRDLLSTRSSRLKELDVRPADLDEDGLAELLCREPKLLRRPIVTDGKRIIVGLDRKAIADLAGIPG